MIIEPSTGAAVPPPVLPLPEVRAGDVIPRIIHQTHYTADFPQELKDSIAALRAANPGWDYRFYGDSDIEQFIRKEYSDDFFRFYCRIDPSYGAARADLFRYLLMYKVGGVYLDIKSIFTRPIDEILRPGDRYLLAGWHNAQGEEFAGWGTSPEVRKILPSEYQQWHIVAAPGHPFLRAVINKVLINIESYRPWRHGVGYEGVYAITGPVAYTLAIHPLIQHHRYRYERYNDAFSLRYSIYGFYGHHKLFKSHYVKEIKPVVVMTGALRMLSAVYCFLLRATRNSKNVLKTMIGRSAP